MFIWDLKFDNFSFSLSKNEYMRFSENEAKLLSKTPKTIQRIDEHKKYIPMKSYKKG